MISFLISGLAFLSYGCIKFIKTKIFYPSVIFSAMWGLGCVIMYLILDGNFENLFLANYYNFIYLDKYILWFAFTSIGAFYLAHKFFPGTKINVTFTKSLLGNILDRYHWIMWLNFIGGIIRIVIMINLVGFDSIMDYRLAANNIMMGGGGGIAGIVFRITAYIQMLANFYIALSGFNAGWTTLTLKKTIILFILYAPTQLATGGRLFVLYFVLFYFGAFLLGRGYALTRERRKILKAKEKKVLFISFAGLLSLVSLIALSRGGKEESKESPIAKFTYITEGMLETEHYMRFNTPEDITPDYGVHFFTGRSASYLRYRGYLIKNTRMSSIVISVITPLYTSFGYWGSIFVWGVIAFLIEALSIILLKRLTIIRLFILVTLLKIMYESVIAQSIFENIPTYELLVLFAIFYQPIFGEKGARVHSHTLS